MKELSKRDKKVLFQALRDAEDWQSSLSDAWHGKGKEAEKADQAVGRYREIRQRLALDLKIGMKTNLEILIESADTKTFQEIKKMSTKQVMEK